MARTAGIVVIGDEILSGKFADENAAFLIGELRALGVSLRRIAVIPDDLDDIARTVVDFSGRFDLVFTSGGVGPTHDDVTIAGISRGFGTRPVIEPRIAQLVRAYFGPELGEKNLRLAEVPEGAELVAAQGWPTVRYRNVYILPGVPAIFRRKFEGLREQFRDAPFVLYHIYCAADEGSLAEHLDAVVAAHPAARIGSYPRMNEPEFRVLLTVESQDPEAAEAAFTALRARLGELAVRAERA